MIYVIEEGLNGQIKIGTSSNPEKRLKALQGGNSRPLKIIMVFSGGHSLENKIHKDLSDHRDRSRKDGEWFNRNDEVFNYLNDLSLIQPETETLCGCEYILLWRDTEQSPTGYCPFCGKRHVHGSLDGHRVAHCVGGNKQFIRKSDGKVFEQSKGYIVRTKKTSTLKNKRR